MATKYTLNKLNREIAKYTTTNNYFQDIQTPWQGILDVLFNNQMALDDHIGRYNNNGNIREVWTIENSKIVLTFSTYRMASGSYEITAYFS